MPFKFVVLLSFAAVACAGVIPATPIVYSAPTAVAKTEAYTGYSAPVEYTKPAVYPQQVAYVEPGYHAKTQPILTKAVDEYDPHPQYKFGYEVQDAISGDSKNQVETRDGDVVQGEYSLIDADGYKRTVQYTADPEHGFNAVVHREPIAVKAPLVAYAADAKAAYATPANAYGH